MKIREDIIQGSDEWFECRKGRLTASNAQAIANNGKGLDTYVLKIVSEMYSSETDKFSNKDTERGLELEPIARSIYELETGNKVLEVGLIEIDEYVSVSPDGLIGEDGGLEIKCLNDINHTKAILYGLKEVDKKYLWQVQMCLLLTERKWWDLTLFNPNYSKSLLVFRIEPDEKMQTKLKEGIEKGKNLIQELIKKYER